MCARLGFRQAFSQAHRPQANGKAESAGKQVITLMRKMHAEEGMNWVEALPRVLMRLHDMAGEGGLSPHQIRMGRFRSLGTLPYNPERDCPDAEELLDYMAEMDSSIAKKLKRIQGQEQNNHNQKVRSRIGFQVGDRVLVMKPKSVGGNKIYTWWYDPTEIAAQNGRSSYSVFVLNGGLLDVHLSQLKFFHEITTDLEGYRYTTIGMDPRNLPHTICGQHRGAFDKGWQVHIPGTLCQYRTWM